MLMAYRLALLLGALMGAGLLAQPNMPRAAESVMNLKWDQLVPPAPPKPPRTFFGGRPGDPGGAAQAPGLSTQTVPEGRWMSGPAKPSGGPPAVVAALDGKRVQIGGYVVPLDFDATRV